MDEKFGSNIVDVGVDLSEFYMSVEWDILEVPAVRWVIKSHFYILILNFFISFPSNEKFYTCCDEVRA